MVFLYLESGTVRTVSKKHLYYLLHKPYKVLSQFTDEAGNPGLGTICSLPKDVYPVGRLDLDSEGLLILSNDRTLNNKLLNPQYKHKRTYWVEVEGMPNNESLTALGNGVEININGKKYQTQKAEVAIISPAPALAEREPPVNYLKHPKRTWLEIKLTEGKNRQVRKMTAKVGHPTLRLVRVAIEQVFLGDLRSGDLVQVSEKVLLKKLHLTL